MHFNNNKIFIILNVRDTANVMKAFFAKRNITNVNEPYKIDR
jgi:hypothetical protein